MSAPADSHVYISYNTRDLPFVENLYERLSQAGLNPWLDRRELVGGDNWRERIAEAVATAYALVVVLSPNAAASEYVREDVDNARKARLRIIPVLIADIAVDDNPLADTQWINFRDEQRYPWDELISLLERERSNFQPRMDPDAARNALNVPPQQQKRTKAAPQSKRAPRKGGDPVDDEEEEDEEPVVQVAVQSNAPPNNIDPAGTPPTPPPPTFPLLGSLRGAGNDRVSDQDQLGFNNYVYAFADLIESRDTTPPLTIGIYGSWGSGKSFLLNSIVRELEKPSAERLKERKTERVVRKVRVIEFNAWEYNATEVIWAGLVRKIIDKLEGDLRLGSLERRARRVRYNFGRHWR
ncbi:MAG: TIR domain-containing protein, partial [Anaerolineae bacterium]|nr:TIR domain-containing protein [Anaerolineae bacterium]